MREINLKKITFIKDFNESVVLCINIKENSDKCTIHKLINGKKFSFEYGANYDESLAHYIKNGFI